MLLHPPDMEFRDSPSLPVAIVIPAYEPNRALIEVLASLSCHPLVRFIVVVDDGSGAEYHPIFTRVEEFESVHLLRHATNLGKGAALKTGINFALATWPEIIGVVTADADGQHDPDDIVRIACRLAVTSDTLILGSRYFETAAAGEALPHIPLRSRFGNGLTRLLVRLVVGQGLTDTQTGLRGIPRDLGVSMLKSHSSGYDFELDMLIAARHQGFTIEEDPIKTIYEPGNPSSHFNPLIDSSKIYFVLFRFSLASLASALVDNAVFWLAFQATANIAGSQAIGRAVSVCVNYALARRAVFLSNQSHKTTIPRYLLLVCVSGLLSYALIRFFIYKLPISVMPAKIAAETIVFFINFAVQRDFVFTRHEKHPPTPRRDPREGASREIADASRE